MSDYNPFSLNNKKILITGASSGIGRSTAIECSKLGAEAIITDIEDKGLSETFINLKGPNHIKIQADLTNEKEIENLVSSIPKLDGCANIAGIGNTSPVQFINKRDLERVYNVNLYAPMYLTKQLIKSKKLNNPSSIVYVASVSGVFSFTIGKGIYGSSKAALNAYMKITARELAGKGIRCNCVNPGMVNTPFIKLYAYTSEFGADDMNKYPIKRYGNPEEIALAIIYLLSDASSYITGHSLVVDGGMSIN